MGLMFSQTMAMRLVWRKKSEKQGKKISSSLDKARSVGKWAHG